MTERRSFQRETEDRRRDDLITAALDLLAEGGPQAATVRAISARAGVTAGLIRYYFDSKDALTRAAYGVFMQRMTAQAAAALQGAPNDPAMRLARFIVASVSAPVVDALAVGLWAGFLHETRRDPEMRAVHAASYLGFRDQLQALIADLPQHSTALDARRAAIACNSIIDGLWMEGSLLPEAFAAGEVIEIALISAGAVLGVDLRAAHETDRNMR
jgi:TetR/AcrR family transcriptional regulator, transcriptional repressor of bet genes